ncbi:STAS domain-containing protein [candidate division CSSED10-310 bacterium]|uniref:STAS domain-containing protein n=1 Tax=candidate division CSSED10-310 bacterium TaxID=2855610 RepID=A0ABV6YVH9_UNCC1
MTETVRIPIIKLYNNLIVSIQIALSDRLVSQLKDDIAMEIEKTEAKGLIIDVSGVDLMDSYISRTIRDIAHIAAIMGVETVISGLDPMVALTLVEMGMNLEGIKTALNLESAFEYLVDRHKTLHQDDEIIIERIINREK